MLATVAGKSAKDKGPVFSFFSPILKIVPARSCRVSCTDSEGIEHAVEVVASSLYEADDANLGPIALTRCSRYESRRTTARLQARAASPGPHPANAMGVTSRRTLRCGPGRAYGRLCMTQRWSLLSLHRSRRLGWRNSEHFRASMGGAFFSPKASTEPIGDSSRSCPILGHCENRADRLRW
jgi:hypothetical protein